MEDVGEVLVGEALGLGHLDGAGLPCDLLIGAVGEADGLPALQDRVHGNVVEECVMPHVGGAAALQLGAVSSDGGF